MATTSKKSKSMTALVVAIIVVIAAIGFVVYDEMSSHSKLFESEKFAAAVAEALGTTPAGISEEKLSEVKYIELSYNAEEELYYVALGKNDFAATYKDYIAKSEAGEENLSLDIEGKFKDAVFELKEGETLADLKYFTGLEIISASGVPVNDSSVFANMKNLTHVFVTSCGLTEVAGLAGLNAETLYEVNLTGNEITDWSPLDYVQDKVLVSSTYSVEQTEDGSYTLVPVEQTLADYYAEKAEEAEAEEAEGESEETVEEVTEEAAEEATEEAVEEVTGEEEVNEETAE